MKLRIQVRRQSGDVSSYQHVGESSDIHILPTRARLDRKGIVEVAFRPSDPSDWMNASTSDFVGFRVGSSVEYAHPPSGLVPIQGHSATVKGAVRPTLFQGPKLWHFGVLESEVRWGEGWTDVQAKRGDLAISPPDVRSGLSTHRHPRKIDRPLNVCLYSNSANQLSFFDFRCRA